MNRLREKMRSMKIEYEEANKTIPKDKTGKVLTKENDPSLDYWEKRNKQVVNYDKLMADESEFFPK